MLDIDQGFRLDTQRVYMVTDMRGAARQNREGRLTESLNDMAGRTGRLE